MPRSTLRTSGTLVGSAKPWLICHWAIPASRWRKVLTAKIEAWSARYRATLSAVAGRKSAPFDLEMMHRRPVGFAGIVTGRRVNVVVYVIHSVLLGAS